MTRGLMEVENDDLVRRAIRNEPNAMHALIRAYEGMVYKFAFRVCRQPELAKETVQETFVNVIRKLSQFDGKSSFTTWLYRIVVNNCLMHRRRDMREEKFESLELPRISAHVGMIGSSESSEHAVMNAELRSQLDGAITSLPLEYRIVFVLRDLEDLSAEETAEVLKLSVPAVKSRLRRARLFLRERLEPYMEGSV